MGQQDGQKELFGYHIDLDKRIRIDHPLQRINARIEFTFVRLQVAQFYGKRGNVSVDPVAHIEFVLQNHFEELVGAGPLRFRGPN